MARNLQKPDPKSEQEVHNLSTCQPEAHDLNVEQEWGVGAGDVALLRLRALAQVTGLTV